MKNDPYAALGLTKDATDDEIKKAYRKIARTDHPDLNPGDPVAEARFKDASRAHDLLKDPEQRRRFDAGEIDATGAEQAPRGYYRDAARHPHNPYAQSHGRGGDPFGAGFDANDFFANFAKAQGAGSSGGMRGQDRQYRLSVPFQEAVRGTQTRITMPDGNSLKVTIPEGAYDGQTLRLRGKGDPGFGQGPAGDAYITLDVAQDPYFRREGNDIIVDLPISIDEAILGGKVPVQTIRGLVNLTVPPGATSGQVFRLKGRGAKGPGGHGDQRVIVRIEAPPEIDPSLKEFMREWRKTHSYDPRKGKER